MARLNWYLGNATVEVSATWSGTGPPPPPDSLPIPPYIEPTAARRSLEYGSEDLRGPVLLWRASSRDTAKLVIRERGSIRIIDPSYWSTTEASTQSRLRSVDLASVAERKLLAEKSQETFGHIIAGLGSRDRAYVFGTGPSLTDFSPPDDDGLRIVCNSIVRSQDLLSRIGPHVIVASDPVFHFGPSRYAAQFRRDLEAAVHRYGAWCVVPSDFALGLLDAVPSIRERLLPVPSRRTRGFHVPTAQEPWTKSTSNVLTEYMLPLAFSLVRTVYIAGCDGRSSRDTGFWRHNRAAQYDDLYQSVVDCHPSFFRDRAYQAYYERHTRTLDRLLTWGEEKLGLTIANLTPSLIPALASRSLDI